MKKLSSMVMILELCLASFSISFAEEENVCQHCRLIREYNENHPENNYYWYDDYLKEQESKKESNANNSLQEENKKKD